MPLVRMEVSDFKSCRAHQVIGPFKNFTTVILTKRRHALLELPSSERVAMQAIWHSSGMCI
ncbi:hypothetical protein DEU56DRAFT_844425 [Suillus clintonianus]|uniref:uncharacterized protein n=1 Tax=Suillus clintonianus TaxID=1904413 RepID=UPI001B87BF04|nr:uncharacterized protein DEU56DRAFT_844425 [Suillus clintonianus]KAG2110086.1 hypothetical protein DEU56DRAFT_844425 [Suillus clintonianus]